MTNQVTGDVTPATTPEESASTQETVPQHWQRSDGLELMGQSQDSGLKQDTFMVRRSDGQIIQVSSLLHTVLEEIEPNLSDEEICAKVSTSYGKTLDTQGLHFLINKYLLPLGVVEVVGTQPSSDPLPRARTIMSLTMRLTVIPPAAVQVISRVLSPLFNPVLVAIALAAYIGLGVMLIQRGDIWASFDEILDTPLLMLAMMVVFAACAIVHELGHATATTYGGAKPGRVGVGIYIVFFAYFTDVSDSYRLNRKGRIRVDLGGLYFNVLTTIGLAIGYLMSGSGFLLMLIVVLQVQMAQQLLPTGRFDGYYLIGDISGVPDLFSRAKPALLSLIPGADKSGVADLKPWVRGVVVVWACLVMPLLIGLLGVLVWNLPEILTRTWSAVLEQAAQLSAAAAGGEVVTVILGVISILALVLPVIGIAVILYRILMGLVRWIWSSLRPKTEEAPTAPVPSLRPRGGSKFKRSALEFTDESLLPAPDMTTGLPERPPAAGDGWWRGRGTDSEPIRSAELEQRLKTPIDPDRTGQRGGTRRVIVMSRKGGVDKTTVTAALGNILAGTRGDRVVAVDTNRDAGNLAHRITAPSAFTITDVLAQAEHLDSYAKLRHFLTQSPESQLEVLAADDDPHLAHSLEAPDYQQLLDLVDRYYNLILLDTGTGILDSADQGLLTAADQLVLVLRSAVDSGRAAALTLDWLEAHGYGRLVANAVVVINGVSPGVGAPVTPIAEHFASRCAAVVSIPWDPALENGGRMLPTALQPETLEAFDELAASVASLFNQGGRAPRRDLAPLSNEAVSDHDSSKDQPDKGAGDRRNGHAKTPPPPTVETAPAATH